MYAIDLVISLAQELLNRKDYEEKCWELLILLAQDVGQDSCETLVELTVDTPAEATVRSITRRLYKERGIRDQLLPYEYIGMTEDHELLGFIIHCIKREDELETALTMNT